MDSVIYVFLLCTFFTGLELKPVNETRFTIPRRIEQNHRISLIGIIDSQGKLSISLSGKNTNSKDDCQLIFSPSKGSIGVYSQGSKIDQIEYNYVIENKEYTTFILEMDATRINSNNKIDVIFEANDAGTHMFDNTCKFTSSESIEYIIVKGSGYLKELNFKYDNTYSNKKKTNNQ
ncbi:unnamed protein product, partial [Brenthis ino]